MKSERTIKIFYVNPRRDRQYDTALRDHLKDSWEQPGRTHSQIAHALGQGDAKNDKDYAMAILWALADFVETDQTTIAWYPIYGFRRRHSPPSARKANTQIIIYAFTSIVHTAKSSTGTPAAPMRWFKA